MFRINEVLKIGEHSYRVLQLLGEYLVWIDIDDESAFPELASFDALIDVIDQENLERIDDPYKELAFESPQDGTKARTKRDTNFALIKPLLDLPDFYEPKSRGAAIKSILAEQGSTKQTLYRLARRYWQRGQTPNALLPDYKNSGGKGKRRIAKDKKLGRPRKYEPGTGAKIDEFIERLFRMAIDRYLLKDKGHSFPYAHRRFETLYLNYFPDTPQEELPSNWQMMHFYKREYSQPETLRKRVSNIEYNKDIRPLQGTANTQVLGPGSRYEIDATIADIYLVSDSERGNIVGRPVVYMVIDVFSRMIAGFYIGFENASYAAAMQALLMSATDKRSYCKELGFEIESEDWPSLGLPDAILADRGELLGYQIENLESNFSVRIENTPPYRGDAKGIVERNFKTIQASFGPFVPGYVSGTLVKKRGGKDYRLDAKLTVREFSQIILSSVLYHNQFAVLEKYDRDADMPTNLPTTPIHLWNWGLQHRTGRLHQADEDALRIALLPRKTATLSEQGACLFGIYYTSSELLQLGWTHRGKDVKRPANMEAAYDPLVAERIYLFPEKGSNKYWVCNLADRSREFREASFWDVWQLRDEQKRTTGQARMQSKAKKRQHEQFVIDKIAHAVKSAPDTSGISNAERIRAINENKREEKARERNEKAHRPETNDKIKPGKVIHLSNPEPDLDYPDYIDELFGEDD
ncbi:Mu transposase C-terminal domain-containing protein [Shewanella chilikensis]|uniref:Mu transposase C-terminal domain-containing protein n=1 Tax=Shewanella chilikensis TaxID=558541 RepID=UPI001CD2784F|nr:Mu transposase C-terminal domain-containing protein [Shewanella chilikensis]MCA0952144.1 Mu transposase C-terminal domain-containing protein [Shewanella chilikensis]